MSVNVTRYKWHKTDHGRMLSVLGSCPLQMDSLGVYFLLRLLAGEANNNGSCRAGAGGRLDRAGVVALCVQRGVPAKRADVALADLEAAGLIRFRKDAVQVTNWAVDQATASDVAERQRRFRATGEIAARLMAEDASVSAAAARKEAARLLRRPEVLESLRSLWRTADMAAVAVAGQAGATEAAPDGAASGVSVSPFGTPLHVTRGSVTCNVEAKSEERRGEETSREARSSTSTRPPSASPFSRTPEAAPSGQGGIAKGEVRLYEPVAAAMGVLAKYDVRERNTLRKRLECGEQARGRESAHAEWYRVLEEFCGRRDDPHARRKIRSPGGLLSAMLAESGFKAEG